MVYYCAFKDNLTTLLVHYDLQITVFLETCIHFS